ncbi:MAG: group 1 truncated hemoglobin [Candidatus Sericytochromatia bacterium]|nr:group 1 truncated hemoglobin [Candidatus Sericytochromatia bacterium]
MKQELYQELGGLDKLREIIDTFVDTMFDDVMIGFFFRKNSKQMLKDREFEFAAQFLGADVKYTGKPLGAAHKNHKIKNGQFSRRKQIFKETLESYDVPKHIIDLLMEHTESFRVPITKTKNSDSVARQSDTKLS